jgi:hypothetical protein
MGESPFKRGIDLKFHVQERPPPPWNRRLRMAARSASSAPRTARSLAQLRALADTFARKRRQARSNSL